MTSASLPATSCVVRRVLPAPPPVVFRAWTDPAFAAQWSWGKDFTTMSVSIDCRVGGTWRQQIRHTRTGEVWSFEGEFHEVTPDVRLTHTFHWWNDRGADDGTSLVTVEFQPVAAGTEVVITHTRLNDAKHTEGTAKGWGDVLDCVEACLPRGQ